ncbi:MAG: DUF2723 domain-containing protein [Anaerolineae bacterium]
MSERISESASQRISESANRRIGELASQQAALLSPPAPLLLQLLITGTVFTAALILYLNTLAPSVVTLFDDSLEFQLVTYQLGIAHPTGYPLYTLLGKLFTFLPIGNVAYRVNLMSAFFGAATVGLLYLLIVQIIERMEEVRKRGSEEARRRGDEEGNDSNPPTLQSPHPQSSNFPTLQPSHPPTFQLTSAPSLARRSSPLARFSGSRPPSPRCIP